MGEMIQRPHGTEECARCGKVFGPFAIVDGCLNCGVDLCARCIDEGCCGEVPAYSMADLCPEAMEALDGLSREAIARASRGGAS